MSDIFVIIVVLLLALGWAVLIFMFLEWRKSRNGHKPTHSHKSMPASIIPGAQSPAEVSLMGLDQEPLEDWTLLAIEVPKENETKPQAAESMFATLHGIYRSELDKQKIPQDHISFEIQAQEKSIRFFVWIPRRLQGYVEGQIYAQYQGVNIYEVKDYANNAKVHPELQAAASELTFTREDIFPIKSFENFDVDPLAGITSTLSKLDGKSEVWIQILVRPENDSWRDRAIGYITAVRSGQKKGTGILRSLMTLLGDVMSSLIAGSKAQLSSAEAASKVELPPGVDEALKRIEEKSTKLGFQTKIRLVSLSEDVMTARQHLDLVIGSFKQFNTVNLNGFSAVPLDTSRENILNLYEKRSFVGTGPILNVTELASIFHLPSLTVTTPHIVWAGSKKGEPPANLPLADEIPAEELTVIGVTNFRGNKERFGIKIKDRLRHMYVIGKSGVGKSVLLENMTMDDIIERRGTGVIDPHGDYVDYILSQIPDYRVDDVVLFDPGDKQFPIAFNVLEVMDPRYKVITSSGVVSVFKKIFAESWGPRLEYWLSSAILALLDYPDATLMMIPKLFTETDFRGEVIDHIQDPVIKARWVNEYNTLDIKQRNETISPILNKVGQFLSSDIIRNIVGQPKSSINMRKIIDERKLLLVKMPKGLIGEDNAALLGALIITQIQLAAMSRADVEHGKRTPFYLYVDEFQNFATDAFAVILSEARKYGLSLTLAHQYMNQLSEGVRDAIVGNVGTLISFRVGADDAVSVLKEEFAPVFDGQDLVNLDLYNIYLKLSVDGLTAGAFSAVTLPPKDTDTNNLDKIIQLSRQKYSHPVSDVETEMMANFTPAGDIPSKPILVREGDDRPRRDYRDAPSRNTNDRPRTTSNPTAASSTSVTPPTPSGERPASTSTTPVAPGIKPSESPEGVGSLKKLITNIERKKSTNFGGPEAKADMAKTLMEDLKEGSSNFKDAFEKATLKPEEFEKELPAGEEFPELEPPRKKSKPEEEIEDFAAGPVIEIKPGQSIEIKPNENN